MTSAVGAFPLGASPYGLLDAAGNVREWTTTKWVDNYENYWSDDRLAGHDARSLRGGAWFYSFNGVRCAARYLFEPVNWYNIVGFRVVTP